MATVFDDCVGASDPAVDAGLNRNHARRDEILGTQRARYSGGIKHFEGLDARGLQTLLDERFLAPDARQNQSPTALEFLRFLARWPATRAHGYAVSRRRDDYRVSIEGVACDLTTVPAPERERLRWEFRAFCAGADELQDDAEWLFAWWD